MLLTRADIDALEKRRRSALINSVTGFKPAVLVATSNAAGQSNLAIMTSLVHVGSNPPLLALIFRPDSVERHTLSNIRATGHYTINHVSAAIIDRAHQTAARYPREVSEFAATGLGERWREGHKAPFVDEAPVRLAMELREEHLLAINGTHLLIGEVVAIELPKSALNSEGGLDPERTDSIAAAGLDSYYRGTLQARMSYAKPDAPAIRLPAEQTDA